MNTLTVPYPVDLPVGGEADEKHWRTLIDEPCVIYAPDSEQPWAVYDTLQQDWRKIGDALQHVRRSEDVRTHQSFIRRSRPFGAMPRLVVRKKDSCYRCTFDLEHPDLLAALTDLSSELEDAYQQHRPDVFAHHRQCADTVREEWRLGSGVYTSGIINYNSALNYHRDGANFPRTWNAMVVFRQHTDGGNFVVPGAEVAFPMRDQSYLLLNAQEITHGVSPVKKQRRDGYRTSVVFYSLRQLCRCGSPDEELELARRKRTEREQRRAGLIE